MPSPSTTPAVLSATERQAAVADDLGRSYALELSRVKTDLERELRRLLLKAEQGSRTATAVAARALKLRKELRDILSLAGYDDLADIATVRGLGRMAAAVERTRLAAQVSAFTARDATRIAALKELARLDLLAQGDEAAIAIWRSVVQGVYSQRPVSAILDDLSVAIDKELREAATLYDTTVSIFGRQIEAEKSTDTQLYLYAGPVDGKTREFCLRHVGRVYTRAEIDALDNGQTGSTFLTMGGFNCRHHPAAISRFSELAELHGTGERVPEIAAQRLRALAQRAARQKKAA
jgi:hypothetical protein